jgi:hypothetical protein
MAKLLKMDKKVIAVFLVLILLIAAMGVFIVNKKKEKEGAPEEEGAPIYPYLDCDPECNIPLSIRPRPSAETHVAVNPQDPNNIVASSNDLNNPSQDVWLHYYTTKDGGRTWSDAAIPGYRGSGDPSMLTGMGTSCDPVVVFDNDNNVYFSGVGYNRHYAHVGRATLIFVARSSDGGETIDYVTQISNSWTRQGRFHDKEWMAVDLNTGNVYVTWTNFVAGVTGNIMFSKSTDNARTFTYPMKIAEFTSDTDAQGSYVMVDKDGTIHVVWRDFSDDTIHYTKSTDEGGSWAPVKVIVEMDPPPWVLEGGTYRTPTMPTMAIDYSDGPYSGSLYVTWMDQRYGDSDILLTSSHDGGETWNDTYVRVNNDTLGNGADQFFPAITCSPQGYIHIMFYDKRYDPNQTLLGVTYAVSTDGGQNFSINLNVTDTLFDGEKGGKSNWSAITGDDSAFIGDYLGIAATNETAYLTWADTRNASETDGNSDIYAAKVVFCDENGDVSDTYEHMKKNGP